MINILEYMLITAVQEQAIYSRTLTVVGDPKQRELTAYTQYGFRSIEFENAFYFIEVYLECFIVYGKMI